MDSLHSLIARKYGSRLYASDTTSEGIKDMIHDEKNREYLRKKYGALIFEKMLNNIITKPMYDFDCKEEVCSDKGSQILKILGALKKINDVTIGPVNIQLTSSFG